MYKRQSLTCDDAAIPADGSNLAWRAAEVFFRTTGVACDGLHITLEKSIQMCIRDRSHSQLKD